VISKIFALHESPIGVVAVVFVANVDRDLLACYYQAYSQTCRDRIRARGLEAGVLWWALLMPNLWALETSVAISHANIALRLRVAFDDDHGDHETKASGLDTDKCRIE
jgi:hypothetical protein